MDDKLPNIELLSGEYFAAAINAQAMMNVFDISVQPWSSGALSNGGEKINPY